MLIGRHLTGLHTSIRAIENNFGGWARAIGGATMMLGGLGMLGAMKKLVEATKDYSAELVKIERLGGGMGSMVRSGAFETKAFDVAKKSGLSVVDAMKIPGSTYSIMGSDISMEMWQKLADYTFVQKQSKDSTGNPKDDLTKLIRAGEASGRLNDPITSHAGQAQLEKYLDMLSKITAATHGTVNADTMLGLAKQGGFTLRGLNDEGFLNLAMMSQVMGGNRAGTSLLSLWGQLSSGTMLKRSAQGMEALGLLGPEGKDYTVGKGGQVTITEEASKRLSALINKDPTKLVEAVRESLVKQGIKDPEDQMRMIMKAMGRQTTQRFLAEEVMNFAQMQDEAKRIQGGLGNKASHELYMDKSVAANLDRMSNAWTTLLNAVAGPNAQASIGVMKEITGHLNSMTDAVRGLDPGTVSMVAKGLVAFATALVALGAVAIISIAGIPGIIVAAVAALASLIALNWAALQTGVDAVHAAVEAFRNALNSMAESIWEFVKKTAGKIGGMFTNPGSIPGADNPAGDGWGAAKQKMNFNPGDIKMKAAPITLALNVDGRALAQTVSQEIDYLHEHPISAPSYDNTSRFGPADGGMISG